MSTLLIGAATRGLAGVDADLDAMAAAVTTYGLDAPVVVRDATLTAIRRHLAELLARTTGEAPVLLYLTGHGGTVANSDHDARAVRPGPQRLHYFRAMPGQDGQEEALFDAELSLWCARLAARSPNVVVVVDCCHASGMVRDDAADQAFAAAFLAWRDAHQDEVDGLDVEAHPDVVRLSAAGVFGFARPGERGSVLTSCLVAALAEPGASQRSWFDLFARLEVHMARSGFAQEPRLSGPVWRQVFALAEGHRAAWIDDGIAQVVRLLQGGGAAIGAMDLRVAWGRVRNGVCAPMSGAAAEVEGEDRLYVRIENVGRARRFVGVFWVGDDGEVALLTRSESMGVELDGKTAYLVGDRPFARAPHGVVLPRRPLAAGERRRERLVVVGASRRQTLWSAVGGGGGRRAAELVGVDVVHFTVTGPISRGAS